MARSLIEQWFPAAAVGAESLRERGSAKAFPPINFLHVWWARRPLIASRAAILASILPAWPSDEDLRDDPDVRDIQEILRREFPAGESAYHDWFLRAIGIVGDPVKGRAFIKAAHAAGTKFTGNGYGYTRAFTRNPDESTLKIIRRLVTRDEQGELPTILDSFAGGGSIPFEALRYHLPTISNELNPVASAILEGTVVEPFKFGKDLSDDIAEYGSKWAKAVQEKLKPFYPERDGVKILDYIWAHTVPCPTTGLQTPLSPNFWLDTSTEVALSLKANVAAKTINIDIIKGGERATAAGNRSTYKNGTGISIWTNEPFDGDYIRAQAREGAMGEMLLALVYTTGRGREYAVPVPDDLEGVRRASDELAKQLPAWELDDLVPTETRFVGPADRSAQYGLTSMRDLFTDRQLLANVTALDELRVVSKAAVADLGLERGKAVTLYLAFALDKIVDYNSMLSSWDTSRTKIRNTFDRHDFSFKWSFAEFEGACELIPWAVNNAVVNHENICKLLGQPNHMFERSSVQSEIIMGSATALPLDDGSVGAIVTDPPYYDNVMYAECSDFFYVWLKRALRDTWPQFCSQHLTDKDREAVANPALFKDVATRRGSGKRAGGGKTAMEIAEARYEQLLTESFREAHRALRSYGVMTVMFTHKRVEAWDTLGMALLESGFTIESSWPVHTESENSLHQAKKNSASSTIMLTCRRRQAREPAYWSDIRRDLERTVEKAVARFSNEGITGVDLTLATYGPALSILSKRWPVYTGNTDSSGQAEVIRPDVALDLAREKVALMKKRGLLGGRQVEFDRQTDYWLLAWNDFMSREFPSGEALKLSIATHLDLDDLERQHGLLVTSSGNASILTPAQRRAMKKLDPVAKTFTTYIDALHALMLTYETEGLSAARAWLKGTGYSEDPKFKDLIVAALQVVPRTKSKERFIVPEATTLESIRATLFEDVPAPSEEPVQLDLVGAVGQ